MAEHICPKYCHRCPDMKARDIMPGCWGGVIYNDLHRCTCKRPTKKQAAQDHETTVLGLQRRVEQLEKRLSRAPVDHA